MYLLSIWYIFSIAFPNNIKSYGFPNQALKLKIVSLRMLFRNIDQLTYAHY